MGAAAAPGAAARPGATARPGPAAGTPFAGTSNKPTADAGLARARAAREALDRRLATLESRGAGVWGGRDFATARQRAAEAVGALDAGSARIAEERLAEGARLLGSVEGRAGVALANQLAAGQRALDAGQSAAALQAFESARRIDPGSRRASEGLRRARSLDRVLPLLAEGENAESQQDHGRAVQAYSQALTIDPSDAKAKAGLERARAALGSDNYAKALGQGYAALGQDHIEEARAAFDRARSLRLDGPEAAAGLARVGAALRARGFEGARARAADLEAQERWSDALQEYEGALAIDPSLQFAQAGKARAAARNELGSKLQGLLDRPERLAAPSVRAEALALLDRARSASPSGPVIRSQIARLEILLPEFDKPVRVALESDNATRVMIQRVGEFGPFTRRELELKPGKYTIVGTRAGYRDVRHDVTVAPGQEVQTISVRCLEPI